MAESGAQLDSGDSDEDRGLQELEMELEKIQAQIRAARKRQDRQQTLRRQIEVARKELATITGDEKGKITVFAAFIQISLAFILRPNL